MKPVFTVGCIETSVTDLYGRGLWHVKNVMTGKAPGYQFSKAYKNGYWDGNICLFKDGVFPSGLLFLATGELQEAGIEYEIIDNQPHIDIKLDLDLGYTLRDLQIEAILIALEHKRGILKLATNAGKTLVMAGIIKSTGNDALVVVPTKPLLHQTQAYLQRVLGLPVGKIGDGYFEHDYPVVVSTMNSLGKLVAMGRVFKALLLDEVHRGKAKSISEPAKLVETPIRIGLSGTPLSYNVLNDLNLMGMTGPLLYEVTNTDLIEAGYSARPRIIFHEINLPVLAKKVTYQKAYDKAIVNNLIRNELIANIASTSEGLTLILVDRLEHVANLLELIPGAVAATGASDNVALMANMKLGLHDTVIATNVFSEGIDIEGIYNIVLAGAGLSHTRLLQRIGRGLRLGKDKFEVIIHDFIDTASQHLLNQSDERLATYEREGFYVTLGD